MAVCSILVYSFISAYERTKTSKSLLRKGFDLLRNSPSTVSIYADECELLVLTALVTSARLSKNKFFDSLMPSHLGWEGMIISSQSRTAGEEAAR